MELRVNGADALGEIVALLKGLVAQGKGCLAEAIANEAPLAFDLPPLPKSRAGLDAYAEAHAAELPLLLEAISVDSPYMRHLYGGKNGGNFTARNMARYHVADLVKGGRWDTKGDAAAYAAELAAELAGREGKRVAQGAEARAKEAEIQAKVAAATRRKGAYQGGDRDATKRALLEAAQDHEGLIATKLADLVTTGLDRTVVLGLIGDLVRDGLLETYKVMLDKAVRAHRIPDEFSGMSVRELAAHPLNLAAHNHHFSTLSRRLARGMRPKAAILEPANQGGKGLRRPRRAAPAAA